MHFKAALSNMYLELPLLVDMESSVTELHGEKIKFFRQSIDHEN